MARRRKGELPTYRLHKQSGQAIVSLPLGNRKYRDLTLGPFGSEASKREYTKVINEWLSSGRLSTTTTGIVCPDISISELCLRFWKHAEDFYRCADGSPSGELNNFRYSLDPLESLYGPVRAKEFGPVALKAVRQQIIDSGRLCRKIINARVEHIKRMFKWAVSEELVPSSIYEGLRTVAGLRRGHPGAPDRPRVRPVPQEHVDAVLPLLCRQVAAMIQLHQLMGARSSEICKMRTRDIDRSGDVWWYRIDPNETAASETPNSHKTGHHETADGYATIKLLPIGPKAQAILTPWLRENHNEFLFQPCEARAEQNAARRAARKTPMTPSQRKRRPKPEPKRKPKERYESRSYARAIKRACELAKVPHWFPHQLKHNCGTSIRKSFGAEACRLYLGHSQLSTTEIYAEANLEAVKNIARKFG